MGSHSAVRRVLIIEDNPDGRASLRLLLELSGYQVEVAENGHAGLHKALEWRPDAALVDIGLPLIDGYQVARNVRAALGEGVRLIAVTAYGSAWDRDLAFLAGFDAHLPKPADPKVLLRTLAEECLHASPTPPDAGTTPPPSPPR